MQLAYLKKSLSVEDEEEVKDVEDDSSHHIDTTKIDHFIKEK